MATNMPKWLQIYEDLNFISKRN